MPAHPVSFLSVPNITSVATAPITITILHCTVLAIKVEACTADISRPSPARPVIIKALPGRAGPGMRPLSYNQLTCTNLIYNFTVDIFREACRLPQKTHISVKLVIFHNFLRI